MDNTQRTLQRRRYLAAGAGLATAVALPRLAWAQAFPNRPIRIIVISAPGSGVDLSARVVAKGMSEVLGQGVVVENVPGASGFIGTRQVARAAPDGYTLLATHTGVMGNLVTTERDFDMQKQLAPVSIMTESEIYFIGHIDMPWANLAEYITYAKANPNKLNNGTAGPNDLLNLYMAIIKKKHGLKVEDIFYKDGGSGYNRGLIAKEVQTIFGTRNAVVAGAKARYSKPLAVSGKQRMPAMADLPSLPDVPTFNELGFPEIEGINFMLFGVAGTPAPVIDRLNEAVNQAFKTGDTSASLVKMGLQPAPTTSAEMGRKFAAQLAQLKAVAPVL